MKIEYPLPNVGVFTRTELETIQAALSEIRTEYLEIAEIVRFRKEVLGIMGKNTYTDRLNELDKIMVKCYVYIDAVLKKEVKFK